MEPALTTHGLRKVFGDVPAVDGIDLVVPRGSFYGFLGPNGAGKSTTIKCLTGLLRPSAGSFRILGLDPADDAVAIRRKLGVVPEDLGLFERLTAAEILAFVGQVHGLARDVLQARSTELLAFLDLTPAAGELVTDYSHGMRKKLALAAALLPAPRLLFLDEPFEGIDAVGARKIRHVLSDFVAGGGTVFLTSHVLEVVERLCDHVGVIHRGRLVAQGPLDVLRETAGRSRTLEEVFLDLVAAPGGTAAALDWLSS
ncbi:MAG TPA: ABC transporter ATP-binding protein [Candidatus Polarisedimenticolaceae bacterium]|nr:ABC transporter ATP-binding protein [Candidatus Polarisedimenticolaceae bacterium]